jgi:hypothetical protein
MNCKPGDLAVVVLGRVSLGRIVPWPCWDEHPISPEACMEAVRSFSRSGK